MPSIPKFLSDDELNTRVANIIETAGEKLILISPFIALHDRIRDKLKELVQEDGLKVIVMFGKNEYDKRRSIRPDDLDFLKTLPNIEIRYHRRLHAKYYANEQIAILTSMNLLDYSQNNNIEFGIEVHKGIFGGIISNVADTERLYEDAAEYFDRVISGGELCFHRVPQYDKSWLGLTKKYLRSDTLVDTFNEMFNGDAGSARPDAFGYCIRTRAEIAFDPKMPFCEAAYIEWSKYKNPDYRERYCHFSGEPSNGENCFSRPVLRKNWEKARVVASK
jgi:hypothetical protein